MKKHPLIKFLSKVLQLVVVFTVVFIIPAFVASAITMDTTIYFKFITNGWYIGIMSVMGVASVVFYPSTQR